MASCPELGPASLPLAGAGAELGNFECNIWSTKEFKTRAHILECKDINIRKTRNNKPPDYENLYSRNVKKQLIIKQYLMDDMKIKKKLEK